MRYKRKDYWSYWTRDISPINESQKAEVAELKANFVKEISLMKFKKSDRISIDPYFRHIQIGAADAPGTHKVIFKFGPWEFNHIKNWIRKYLQAIGFVEVYHFDYRSPVGAIDLIFDP